MRFAFDWVWGHWQSTLTLLILTAMFTMYFFRAINHHAKTSKDRLNIALRDTFVIGLLFGVITPTAFIIPIEYVNGDSIRNFIPPVVLLTHFLGFAFGRWSSYLLYEGAMYPGGINGWTKERISAAQKFVKERLQKIRPTLAVSLFVLLVGVACISVVVSSTPPVNTELEPQDAAATYNATYEEGATFEAQATTAYPTASPTPTLTPTATLTPTSSIEELPTLETGTYIYEVPPEDIEVLARLCVVEVRGMGDRRADACVSVVSTVLTRMMSRYLSDGTVAGTIAWKCYPGTLECQFPAYSLHGCAGILPVACPWSYPDDIKYFREVVSDFVKGNVRGNVCLGYRFYGSKRFDFTECVIESHNGTVEGFHNS